MSRKTFDKNRLPDWFSLTKYAGSENFNIKSWADAVVIRHDIYSYLLNPRYKKRSISIPDPEYCFVDEELIEVRRLIKLFSEELEQKKPAGDFCKVCEETLLLSRAALNFISANWSLVCAARNAVIGTAKASDAGLVQIAGSLRIIRANLHIIQTDWDFLLLGLSANRAEINLVSKGWGLIKDNWDSLEITSDVVHGSWDLNENQWRELDTYFSSQDTVAFKSFLKQIQAVFWGVSSSDDITKEIEHTDFDVVTHLLLALELISKRLCQVRYSLKYLARLLDNPLAGRLDKNEIDTDEFFPRSTFLSSANLPAVQPVTFGDLLWQRAFDHALSKQPSKHGAHDFKCWRMLEEIKPTEADLKQEMPFLTSVVKQRDAYKEFAETELFLSGGVTAVCQVDLTASDTKLQEAFVHWLSKQRKNSVVSKPKGNATDRWAEYQLLAWMDLKIWGLLDHNSQFTRADIARIIVIDTHRIRLTIEPLANKLLADPTELVTLASQ